MIRTHVVDALHARNVAEAAGGGMHRCAEASDLGLTGWPHRLELEGALYLLTATHRDAEGELLEVVYTNATGAKLVVFND